MNLKIYFVLIQIFSLAVMQPASAQPIELTFPNAPTDTYAEQSGINVNGVFEVVIRSDPTSKTNVTFKYYMPHVEVISRSDGVENNSLSEKNLVANGVVDVNETITLQNRLTQCLTDEILTRDFEFSKIDTDVRAKIHLTIQELSTGDHNCGPQGTFGEITSIVFFVAIGTAVTITVVLIRRKLKTRGT